MNVFTSINTTVIPTTDSRRDRVDHTIMRMIFGIIASLALLGNALVCTVVLKERSNLKSSYNMMILALALVDMLTGIILFITPAFVIEEEKIPVPRGLGGELFCRFLSSHYFVFTFAKISIAIVMFLAIDRWFAIARPLKYQLKFNRRMVIRNLVLIVVLCCVMNSRALFEKRLIERGGHTSCKWIPLTKGKLAAQIYVVVHVLITFFIPLVISWGVFLYVWTFSNKSRFHAKHSKRSRPLLHLLRMCAWTSLFLGILWIPNQLYFVLSKFDVTRLDSPLHHVTVILSLFNSCVNPWIYGTTNKKYRKEFKKIVCFWRRNQVLQNESQMSNWQ